MAKSGTKKVAEMLLKWTVIHHKPQQHSATFSAVAQCFRALFGGAGGI
jgi:hypothetical protein